MYADIRRELLTVIVEGCKVVYPHLPAVDVTIDTPADTQNGEFACNIAFQLSRILKKSPAIIAGELNSVIINNLKRHPSSVLIEKVQVKAPGFINFYLSLAGFYTFLEDVFAQNTNYGRSEFGCAKKFCLEFVSANPTGPLTVAHGRQAAVGDTLANILRTVGFGVKKEYYVNDEGNQINILGRSISSRAREILGEKEVFSEDAYQGEYIRTLAQDFINQEGIRTLADLQAQPDAALREFGVAKLMAMIKHDLDDFDVGFDVWSTQSKIATDAAIKSLLADFKLKGFIYEHDGALWFKSTLWKDDKDRVVQKSNGDYTYLTPDIVYHKDKFERGFEQVVNILGPDHHGYIARIKAAAGALGRNPDDLDILIVQLATIFRHGKEVSMSTRRGEFITLREVIDEVGKDAGRFFFLMRQSNAHLEFDLELAKKQSAENPVYYIQYAHARIHSIIRKARGELNLSPKVSNFSRLKAREEIDVLRKVGLYPEVLIGCAKILEPFALVRYVQELASHFHKFYDSCRVLEEDTELTLERLALIEAVRLVLGNALKLLGVSAPEKM